MAQRHINDTNIGCFSRETTQREEDATLDVYFAAPDFVCKILPRGNTSQFREMRSTEKLADDATDVSTNFSLPPLTRLITWFESDGATKDDGSRPV